LIVGRAVDPVELKGALTHLWQLSEVKLLKLSERHQETEPPPVHTVAGQYVPRPWTDWTRGFHHGSLLLQFEATGDQRFFDLGRVRTLGEMGEHLTDFAVHDHGFNIVSTYGNLWRLAHRDGMPESHFELRLYEQALRVSGAVQAKRWSALGEEGGYIYSFNGPHSLFVDSIRTLRSLALGHLLGQSLRDEAGRAISLVERLRHHLLSTARYNVFYGESRDIYDIRGRVAHEALFNSEDGSFRAPSTQQGYSPFSTWSRGLAWAVLGFAEQVEFLRHIGADGDEASHRALQAATATADYYIEGASAADGVPYWDTAAPGLSEIGDWKTLPADPFNPYEPVDSSAAAIAAQGLLRLGCYLGERRYVDAGLKLADVLFRTPYLSESPDHEGLLLHGIYHRPRGWDYIPPGHTVPCGEATMWGDYHARELALCVGALAKGERLPTFFSPRAGPTP
jgi:unsaturated chondroitin disaccharide hydrolase